MERNNLSDRKKKILKSIIDAYISYGEPVGSKFLTERCSFNLSSATLRNEMNELETLGFLEQPHTSAGRIPTSQGYRTYIELLMERYKLTVDEVTLLNELLDFKLGEMSRIMDEASRVISELTNYTAFSVIKKKGITVKRYQLIRVDNKSFILLLICDDGNIRNRHIRQDTDLSDETLKATAHALNTVMVNIMPEQVALPAILRYEEMLGLDADFGRWLLKTVYEMLGASEDERLHISGVTKLLSYPEFYNVSKARCVLEVFERKHDLVNALLDTATDKLNVFIGDDSMDQLIPDSSFVFKPITLNGNTIGGIGVVGPKRMSYNKVIAHLEYFVKGLTEEIIEDKSDGWSL